MARRQAQPRQTAPRRRLSRRMVLSLAGLLLSAAGFGWAGYALTDPSVLPVHTVRLDGQVRYVSREQLRAAIAPYAAEGLLRLDVSRLRRALEDLAWVERAEVRRAWPDGLAVNITEQRPIARWGRTALINERGELFQPPGAQWPEGLPQLAGPAGSAGAIASRFSELQGLFAPLGLELTALVQDERRSWRLRLANGIELMLGREQTAERLLRFMQVYPRVLAERAEQIAKVDLRYTNGFAVAWRDPATAAGA